MSDKLKSIAKNLFNEFDLGMRFIKYGFWLGCGIYMGVTVMIVVHPYVYQLLNK